MVHNVSSGCVNNRKGFIEYQEEDTWGVTKNTSDHYSGRPRGARALISPSMLGTGSDASSYLLPPGWDELPSGNRGRAHLVARQLGGSGKDARNIVAMFQRTANSPAMSSCESKIAAAVKNGECVDLIVTANYSSDDPKPISVTIKANGDRGCFSLSVTISNSKTAATPSACK
ncbi:DNA/RNA non-specific endonuclease [Planctopirus hydrillae]|uniref:DNA/RNA non-specific endonuclease n=1 Tax=Planctopirus hydrillae TaxID=1841610 RepID=UPI001042803D|nr:DNA/RNA non-specific endonuclease [Planctopirus hydrillae]